MHDHSVVIQGRPRRGRYNYEPQATFLSNDDTNPISPTEDVLLDLKRGHIWSHIPGSKVHENQFCPALGEVTNDGHFSKPR
jgi:hypothetical protein